MNGLDCNKGLLVNGRNTQVEGLRSLAMLCVLLFHFCCRFQQIYMGGIDSLPYSFTMFGGIGVGIFFLISGYFFANANGGISFVFHRAKKLLPFYWATLIICFVMTNLYQLPGRTASFGDFLLNFFLLGGIYGVAYVDGAHWFLRTMLIIVVVYAVIQKTPPKKHVFAYATAMLFVISLSLVKENIVVLQRAVNLLLNSFTGFGLECLVISIMGSALALIKVNIKFGIQLYFLCLTSYIYLFGVSMGVAMFFASVVLFLCEMKKLPVLEVRFFQVLAKSSYSIYLIHQNIGYIIMLCLIEILPYGLWMSLFTTMIMIGVGMLLHNWFEEKINLFFYHQS